MLLAEAKVLAGRVRARFPASRVGAETLEEWAAELAKLTPERGEAVIDWLADNLDAAPTFKQIRLAMARTRPTSEAADPAHTTPGLTDPCEFCQQPVANGPDAASRYDAEFDRWFHAHLSCADARVASSITHTATGGHAAACAVRSGGACSHLGGCTQDGR